MNKINLKLIFGTLGILTILFAICNPVFAEERISDFELEIQGPKIVEIAPGEIANFTAKVKNNGNMLENFTIAIDRDYMKDGLPDGWKIEFEQTDFNISSGSERNININVTSNESSDFGDYEIYINITSKDNESTPVCVDNFTVRISFYKPDIIGDTHLNTNTGNFVIYEELNLSLKNRGSAKDVISSEIKSVDYPLTANWEGATPEELLESNESSENYVLRVRIMERTPNNSEKDYEIQLYVNSSKDPTKNEIVIITIYVEKYFNVKVTKEQILSVKPGLKDYVNFTVENTGNVEDQYSISMKGDINFIDIITPEFFTLDSGEKTNIFIQISPSSEPIEKQWWINITTKSENSEGEMGYSVIVISHLNITLKSYYKPILLGTTVADADTNGTSKHYYTYNLRIKNDGSGSDTISMAMDKVDPPLNVYWDGPTPWGDTIDAGAIGQTDYNLKCEIPPNTAEGPYNISVWVNSTNDPTKNKLFIFKLNINIFYYISTSILKETVEIKLEPPYEAIFEVNITNQGNKKMDLRLKYQSGLEPRWNSDPGTTGRLLQDMESGETRTETIRITVDDEAEEGVYENIKFKIYPEDSPLDDEEIDFTVEVLELRKFRLQYAAATAGTVEPVEGKNKVALAIDVYNDGNIDDDILLKVNTVELYARYPQAIKWKIYFCSKEDLETKITSIEADSNDKETVYLVIELPTNIEDRWAATPGSYQIPIYAESKEDPEANSTEDVELIIKVVSEVNVEYTGGCKRCDINDISSFRVIVTNYGNEKDEMTFDVIDNNDWSHPIDDFYKTEFAIGEKREIKVNISIPFIKEDITAVAGIYYIDLEVKPKSGGTKKTVKLDYEIMETYGCKIELIDKIKNETLPDEGTVISYKAKISNLGNSEVSIKVPQIDSAINLSSSDFDKWDVFLETSTSKGKRELDISIKPTESKEITVKIEIHEGDYINTYGLKLRAYPEGKLAYSAEPKTIWLILREPIYKLVWTESSKNQNKEVEPEKDTELEYTVYVENLGTEDDTVTVRVEPLSTDLKGWEVKFLPPGGPGVDEESKTTLSEIKIGDGQIQIFTLVVRPYEKADRDVYDIELTVESEVDTTATDRLLIQTTVKRPDLEIYAEDIILPEGVKEGDLAQIRAKIYNFGNAKARDVEITFYDNIGYDAEEIDSTRITIPVNSSVIVTGDWEVRAGKYYITVIVDENDEIIDSSDEITKATAPAIDIRQDLIIAYIEILGTPYKGETVDVDVTIWNNGSADVNKAEVRLKIGGELISKQDISIIAGQKEEVTLEWKIPNADNDYYKIVVEVDDVINGIDDANKRDNKDSRKRSIESPPKYHDHETPTICVIPLTLITLIIGLIIGFTFQKKNVSRTNVPPPKRYQNINQYNYRPNLEPHRYRMEREAKSPKYDSSSIRDTPSEPKFGRNDYKPFPEIKSKLTERNEKLFEPTNLEKSKLYDTDNDKLKNQKKLDEEL